LHVSPDFDSRFFSDLPEFVMDLKPHAAREQAKNGI